MSSVENSPLGKNVSYVSHYDSSLLCPISRDLGRAKTGLLKFQPFHGADIWNAFELSWLRPSGIPAVALAEIIVPCESPNLIESKSLKLYLNSFNQTHFDSIQKVQETIAQDLSLCAGKAVEVKVEALQDAHFRAIEGMPGICIDAENTKTDCYQPNKNLLATGEAMVSETLCSKLLKSNCLATGQPDWAHIMVRYEGKQIDRSGLLKYIVSFREHQGFHEHCVEQIFAEILEVCKPEKLTVFARYTRRGGLDINPFRSDYESLPHNVRHIQQ